MELGLDQLQSLSASWLLRLTKDAGYGFTQTSLSMEQPFVIGRPDEFHITVTPRNDRPWITAVANDEGRQGEVDELVQRCGELTANAMADGLGGEVWYKFTLAGESRLDLADPMFFTRVHTMLNTRARIVDEWRRLGTDVLLHFQEGEMPEGASPEGALLFPPQALIDVYIVIPGPIEGPFTRPIAHQIAEVVAAICTFALGRPIDLPPNDWPIGEELLEGLQARRWDESILTLARRGVSLDFWHFLALGDMASWARFRGALLSYDAAMRQQREQVAVILFVIAAECLTNPFQPWKKDRLTKRFSSFFDELMPADLDEMVQHGNFEEAFGIVRGSKSERKLRTMLVDALYVMRSEPVHEGLAMAYAGFGNSGFSGLRRFFAAWFAEFAILRYLESPLTSLIGHPVTATASAASDSPECSR